MGASALCVAARSRSSAGAQSTAQDFGKNKIAVPRRSTGRSTTRRTSTSTTTPKGEPLLEKVVSFAESAYDRLSREFDYQIKEPMPLIYYATHSAFEQNNIIPNFIPEGIGAFATSGALPHGAAGRPAGHRAARAHRSTS